MGTPSNPADSGDSAGCAYDTQKGKEGRIDVLYWRWRYRVASERVA